MDTIIGATQSEAILTLTERKTNYLLISKLPKGKDSGGVVKEVFKALIPFKNILKTITTDNGSEFAAHEEIIKKLEVPAKYTVVLSIFIPQLCKLVLKNENIFRSL